jgi:hypothetical protein
VEAEYYLLDDLVKHVDAVVLDMERKKMEEAKESALLEQNRKYREVQHMRTFCTQLLRGGPPVDRVSDEPYEKWLGLEAYQLSNLMEQIKEKMLSDEQWEFHGTVQVRGDRYYQILKSSKSG